MFRGKEGFTLVELLIVLAVIAALLATITPVAMNAVRKARATRVAGDLRNVKSAFEQCVAVEAASWTDNCNGIDLLYQHNYINRQPDNITVTGADKGDTIEATVEYTLDKPSADDISKVYEEAQSCNSSHTCVHARIGKFW